jgi:Tyrosine-protein kinase ephrin type A/B receptor-like
MLKQTSCTKCLAGRYLASSGTCYECNDCEINTFSPEGADKCQPCPSGETSPKGSADCYRNNTVSPHSIIKCPRGYLFDISQKRCVACSAGTFNYNEGQDTSTQCMECQPGDFSLKGAALCAPCQGGSYSELPKSTKCTICPVGEYSTTQSAKCTKCPCGKYAPYQGMEACIDCAKGSFAADIGSSKCTKCTAGKYQAGVGKCDCSTCCAANQYSPPGSDKCYPCENDDVSEECSAKCTPKPM